MWGGTLGFYESIMAGHWSTWWSKWNEHCILLDRVLFWIDLRWFNGNNILLLAMNHVLAGLCGFLFWVIFGRRIPQQEFSATRRFLALLSTACLFLLCQGENLTWAFQGQFWLAFLLPLAAFYWLQRSSQCAAAPDFIWACILGVAAAGSMGNGIATLPLMFLFAIVMRQGKLRIFILCSLSALIAGLYIHASGSVVGHPPLRLKSLLYAVTVLGSPFLFILNHANVLAAQILGFIFIIAAVCKAVTTDPRRDELGTALIFFIGYVAVSLLAIASARLPEHIEPPPSHYTTVAIMGWISLLCLYAPALAMLGRSWKLSLALVTIPLMALTVKAQVKALDNWDAPISERQALFLGLALGVDDHLGAVALAGSGGAASLPFIAQKAYAGHLGLFGRYPYRGSRKELGVKISVPPDLPYCRGSITGVATTTDSRFISVRGRLTVSGRHRIRAVRLMNANGIDIGLAVMGQTTPDRDRALAERALDKTFEGYVYASAAGTVVTLEGEDRHGSLCRLDAQLPTPLFTAKAALPTSDAVNVDTADVLPGNQWAGSDFAKTNLCKLGLRVFGSVKSHGDADSGSITLRLKRGAQLFYRSGPAGEKQTLTIPGYAPLSLPVANDWTLLTFSSPSLPQGPFQVTLADSGTGWGQWSAIAIRDEQTCGIHH